jgi:nitrogen regulatory protein PII|tara:strand:+ start:754 stop:1104 length:351 start_codon:yes stop_codon:yes gene_type:complete
MATDHAAQALTRIMNMKKIEAVLPAFRIHEVAEVLRSAGIDDINMFDVTEFSCDGKHHRLAGAECCVDYRTAVRLEVVCEPLLIEAVKDVMAEALGCGQRNDEMLRISTLVRVVEI